MTDTSDGVGFHTPDYDASAPVVCKQIALPSYLWTYFYGALGELTNELNWVEVGDMPIDDVVQEFLEARLSMVDCP